MFDFKKRRVLIDDFGIQLANEIANRLPLNSKIESARKKESERYGRTIDHALGLIVAFQRDNKLGVYGKARLFNSFKWQLKQLGYADDFIDTTTGALVNFAAARRGK